MARDTDIKQEILKQLDHLPTEMQRRVLSFAQELAVSRPKGVPGRELLQFAGILGGDEANAWMIALASKSSLKKDWLRPEEDDAWQNL